MIVNVSIEYIINFIEKLLCKIFFTDEKVNKILQIVNEV